MCLVVATEVYVLGYAAHRVTGASNAFAVECAQLKVCAGVECVL